MGVDCKNGVYDCNGRFAVGRCYVYFLLARDGEGPVYLKVGMSENPIARAGQIQTGCPFPIVKSAMVKCVSRKIARRVERELHAELSKSAVSGEWMRFDWSSGEARKRLFDQIHAILDGQLREWKFENFDLPTSKALMSAIASRRTALSEARRKARFRVYRALA